MKRGQADHRTSMKKLIILGLCAAFLGGCGSRPITSVTYSDKNTKKSISERHPKVGNQYLLKAGTRISFTEKPERSFEKVPDAQEESFSITDFVRIGEYGETYYKVEFASGKVAWTNAHLFDFEERFESSRADPRIGTRKEIESKIQKENERKAKDDEERINKTIEITETLKKIGISVGSSVWMKSPEYGFTGLQKVLIKKIGITSDVYSKFEVELVGEAAGIERSMKVGSFSAVQGSPADYLGNFDVKDPAKRTAKWGKSVLKAIYEQKVITGMTEEQTRTSWGPPRRINRSGGQWGLHAQWIYGDHGPYLYFENGRLSSWQN